MKAAVRFIPVFLVVVLVTTTFGQIVPGDPNSYPSETIVNSPHNLNNFPGVSIPGNRVCLPCHTPHNALKSGEENVLWNHAETGESFDMYFSTATQPEGRSKMCLSCHDGVTAIDNYGGNGGTGIVITGDAALGTALDNDHPIGVEYITAADSLNDPTTFAPGINGGPGVRLVDVGGADRVECTSCHNVHNNGLGHFLHVPVEESYICLQCHIK